MWKQVKCVVTARFVFGTTILQCETKIPKNRRLTFCFSFQSHEMFRLCVQKESGRKPANTRAMRKK